jgi:hypothetical protein
MQMHPLRRQSNLLWSCCSRLPSRPLRFRVLLEEAASRSFSNQTMSSPECGSQEKPVMICLHRSIYPSLLICLVYCRNMAFRTASRVNISVRLPQNPTSGPSKETIRAMRTFLYIRLLSPSMTARPSGEKTSPKPSSGRSTIVAQSCES